MLLNVACVKYRFSCDRSALPLAQSHGPTLLQRHRKDVSNFDRQFTSEKTDLSPTDKLFMMNLDQNEFAGFSFLNPEFVQHV